MKTSDQVKNEQGVLALMCLLPPLWILVVLLYINGYGRG